MMKTFFSQSALLDLLGSDIITPTLNTNTVNSVAPIPTSNNNDLLDLLGGLDLTSPVTSPVMPTMQSPTTPTSNFSADGLFNSPSSPSSNGKFVKI